MGHPTPPGSRTPVHPPVAFSSPSLAHLGLQGMSSNVQSGRRGSRTRAVIVVVSEANEAGNCLLGSAGCHTLSCMKTSALTIRLDPELEKQLERVARRSGRTRSEVVREALRRQLALAQFEDLRKRMMPFAEAAGYLTDEDVFRDVS